MQASVRRAHQLESWLNIFWMYVSVAFANVIFAGLLSIHQLLDNPYGNHCTKFPLRAQITEVRPSSHSGHPLQAGATDCSVSHITVLRLQASFGSSQSVHCLRTGHVLLLRAAALRGRRCCWCPSPTGVRMVETR